MYVIFLYMLHTCITSQCFIYSQHFLHGWVFFCQYIAEVTPEEDLRNIELKALVRMEALCMALAELCQVYMAR